MNTSETDPLRERIISEIKQSLKQGEKYRGPVDRSLSTIVDKVRVEKKICGLKHCKL